MCQLDREINKWCPSRQLKTQQKSTYYSFFSYIYTQPSWIYFIWHGVWNKHILVQYLWNPFNVEENHYNFSIAISLKRSCLEVSCYVMEIFILLPFDKEKSMWCSFLYLALLYYTMIAGIKQKYNLNSNFCFRLSFCT